MCKLPARRLSLDAQAMGKRPGTDFDEVAYD